MPATGMARPDGATTGAGRFGVSPACTSAGVGATPSRLSGGAGAVQIIAAKNRIIAAIISTTSASTTLCMDHETRFTCASFQRHGTDPHRLLRLELPALARALLSRGHAAAALVRILRRTFRHRRDQQQLLQAAQSGDVRGMAGPGAA